MSCLPHKLNKILMCYVDISFSNVTNCQKKKEKKKFLEIQKNVVCISRVRVARSFIFCLVFRRSLFVLFLLAIVLSVFLRLMASYCPFCIFKLFLTWVGEDPSLVIHCSSNLMETKMKFIKVQNGIESVRLLGKVRYKFLSQRYSELISSSSFLKYVCQLLHNGLFHWNCINDVMVVVLMSSSGYCEFDLWLGQISHYKIGICVSQLSTQQ